MAANEISTSWLEIQQDIKQDFITYITKPELVTLVKTLDLDVQGFSKRNVQKAHLPLLKQAINEALDLTIDLKNFFITITMPFYDQMKDYDYDTFLLKASLEDDLTSVDKLLLLAILFPDQYKQNREYLVQNLQLNNGTFAGVFDPPMNNIFQAQMEKFDLNVLIDDFLDLDLPIEAKLPIIMDLRDFFSTKYQDLKQGYMLQFLNEYDLNDFDFDPQVLLSIYQLALAESIVQSTALIQTYKEDTEKIQAEKSRLETKLQQFMNRRKDATKQWQAKEKQLDMANHAQKEEIKTLTLENKSLEEKLKRLRADIEASKQKQSEIDLPLLQETEPFYLITKQERSLFTSVVPNKVILDYKPSKSFTEQFKSLPTNKFIFMEVNDMSSKQQLRIENYLTRKKLPYKFVSGTPERIVRQIIFYLEGDLIDETNQ